MINCATPLDSPFVCACPYRDDGVDVLCSEQRRLDASFTWQLQGCGDVSESAEALIITGVNHCSGNPEDVEEAWGEVSRESGRCHHRRPLQQRNATSKAQQLVRLSHDYRRFMITRWRSGVVHIYLADGGGGGVGGQRYHLLKWTISRNTGNVKPDLWSVYSAVWCHSPELGS